MSNADIRNKFGTRKLGDVCRFQGGTQPPQSTFIYEPAEKYVRLLQIRDFETDDHATYVSEEYNLRYVDESDVLLARYGASVGKILTGKSGAINVALMKAIPDEEVLTKPYLFYFLKTDKVQRYLKGLGGRSAQAGFNQGELNRIDIYLPPISEQYAIAQALRAAQKARDTRERELGLEREHKMSLTQYLFSQGTNNEPGRQSEIGIVPESWKVERLQNAIHGTRYGLSMRGESEGTYPILRMNNLVDGGINTDSLQYVDLAPEVFERFKLHEGDILFNRTNSYELVGKTSIFRFANDYVFASYLIRILVDKDKLNPDCLNFYLNWNKVQKRLKTLASRGVSQSNINATKLINFLVPLPPPEEQAQIVQVLQACEEKIAALENELVLLKELFRTMLELLMTGRLSAVPLVESELVELETSAALS